MRLIGLKKRPTLQQSFGRIDLVEQKKPRARDRNKTHDAGAGRNASVERMSGG